MSNKEELELLLDEAYKNYLNYPLATIGDDGSNILYKNWNKGWSVLTGLSFCHPHPIRHLLKEEFIIKCKSDSEFSEYWGLKIEERELSLEERFTWMKTNKSKVVLPIRDPSSEFSIDEFFRPYGVPKLLITITGNRKL